jgi:DNA polymerase-3 subunit delta'
MTALKTAGAQPPQRAAEQAALHARAGGSVRQSILLTTYGGLEIAETLERAARSSRLAPSEAHRLADAVNGRERSVQFEIFNDHALGMLNRAALAAAGSANLADAYRYSQVWDELRVAIAEADTYNLDRKQHALNMILRLNETFRM